MSDLMQLNQRAGGLPVSPECMEMNVHFPRGLAVEASFEAVEKMGLPAVRPMLGGGSPGGAMFESFLRSGSGGVEMKAFTGVSDAAGGYAVPESIDAQIDATLKAVSPITIISAGAATMLSPTTRVPLKADGPRPRIKPSRPAATESCVPLSLYP